MNSETESAGGTSVFRVPTSATLSPAEYRALVDYSPVMIWRSGLDARCYYFNETWLAFTGRLLDEEIGNGWAERVHPDDLQSCLDHYLRCFHKRESFDLEYRLRRHDGIYRWIVNRGTPCYDAEGSFAGFIGSCVDIDDRRRAQEEREDHHQETLALYSKLKEREAKIRRLIDSNIVGVVFSNPESEVYEANDAFLAMLGYTKEDVRSGRLRWRELTPPEWRAPSERAAAQLSVTGTCDVFEKEYFRRDGSRVPVLIGAAAMGDGYKEVVAFVLDITERKRAEEERERLREAQSDLTYVSRVLTLGELAASFAHEIRQPINAALVSAETVMLLLERSTPDVAELRDATKRMAVEARRASDIIDRIQSLYKRSTPRMDAINVNDLVMEMVTLLGAEADRHHVSIRTELESQLPLVAADRVQLQQVLLNLMLNAVDAMKGAPGEMKITSQRSRADHVVISVIDSGVGLPTGQVERIFDAFFTTKPDGTGMGLAISRAIIESHGGLIWARANPERGATFQFSLPRLPAAR